MRWRVRTSLVAGAFSLMWIAIPALPQTGRVVGSVTRDSSGHPIGGAEIRLPTANRITTSNYMGEFRFDDLAPGRYPISIRSIGFRSLSDTVSVTAGGIADREFILAEAPVALPTVHSDAASKKYISPRLNAFEERRAMHAGGQFVTDSMLRRSDNERMIDVLNRLAGMVTIEAAAGSFAASDRSSGGGGPAFGRTNLPCYVSLFIDGNKVYQGPASNQNPAPNLNLLNVSDYAAIEYYSGPSTLPMQFSTTSSCGTLLLWTRER